MAHMGSLLRTRPGFRRLWAAGAVSLAGDWLSFVAVSALALASGGGAIGLAIVFAAHALPSAILAPLAGAIVDRLDRRRVLVAADVIAAIVTAAMAGAAVLGWIGAVQLLLLARSAVSAIVPPGESAALRRVVAPNEIGRANALLAVTWSVAYVAGMSLGGIATLLGPALALALDAASFAAAAALHATLPPMPAPESATPVSALAIVRDTPRDTVAALRVAASRSDLLAAVMGKAPLALAGGAGWIALNMIGAAERPFGAAALSFGILQAVRGAGTGIGPAIAAWLARRGAVENELQWISRIVMLAAVLALAVARTPDALVAVTLVWGMGTGANWVLSHTALQRHSPDAVIGRLSAFDELLVTVAMVLGAFAGAAAVTAAGIEAAAILGAVLGGLGIATALAVTRARWPQRNRGAAAIALSVGEGQAAHVVHDAEVHAVVTQDRVCEREMEMEVR
jgi:predicted MFS family arabinose efflux permease